MPELPDVELYRIHLEAHAMGREIAAVTVPGPRILYDTTPQALGRRTAGHRFDRTRRRGKHLLAHLDDDGWVAFHFGMSGRLQWFEDAGREPDHTRVRFDFADDAEAFFAEQDLGPDAVDPGFRHAAFVKALSGRMGTVKGALTNQSVIAGIGNIYADEILFQTRLHPRAAPAAPDEPALAAPYDRMRDVLCTAIERGAGSERYLDRLPDGYLLPHRAAGDRCPRCGGKIARARIAGRGSYFCPACQKDPGQEASRSTATPRRTAPSSRPRNARPRSCCRRCSRSRSWRRRGW